MSDDTTTTAEAAVVPEWLRDAEAAYLRRKEGARARQSLDAGLEARMVNATLDQLGITPVTPAKAHPGNTWATPALLIANDPENELYSVHAEWDTEHNRVRLLVGHYWGYSEWGGLRISRPLTSINDVVAARHEGAAPEPALKPLTAQDLRGLAEGVAVYSPPLTTSQDTDLIASRLSGLTAAVLYLADSVTRAVGRV